METKRYLGDGVYAALDCGMVRLYTSDGLSTLETIYLEPEVLDALLRFINDLKEHREPQVPK